MTASTEPGDVPGPDVTVPDVAEPFTAYRAWYLDHDGRLTSPTVGTLWEPGRLEVATCKIAGRSRDVWSGMVTFSLDPLGGPMKVKRLKECTSCPSPVQDQGAGHPGHGCGIYAYRSIEMLVERAAKAYTLHHAVLGEVAVSGRVYEYEHGYRAQHATITALYAMPGQPTDQLDAVAARYQVPVRALPARLRKPIAAQLATEADREPDMACLWPSQRRRLERRRLRRRWGPAAYTALLTAQVPLTIATPTRVAAGLGWAIATALYLEHHALPRWKETRRG